MRIELPSTAYGPEDSREYDESRFGDPHGRLFNELEAEQFSRLASPFTAGDRVLEVGCGTGRFMGLALDTGAIAYGLDASPHMLAIAREKLTRGAHAFFVLGEGSALCFQEASFDYVYSIRTINQLPSREYAFMAIEEMIRVCRPGGAVLLEFINRWGLNRFGKSVRMSVGDIQSLVARHHSVRVAHVAGILAFSTRAMSMTPVRLLGAFGKVDRLVARCLPALCARCYVLLEKD